MIYLLIGQKGSGKTFIGELFEKHFNIKFVRVEDWAKPIKKDRKVDDENYLKEVFAAVENGIRGSLQKRESLVFESTGLTKYFDAMLLNLQSDFKVVTIGVKATSELCLDRVKSRDQSIHINVSDEQVNKINDAVIKRNRQTDFVINNNNKSEPSLVDEIANIINKNVQLKNRKT
ncbi:hypothetical protein FVB32_11535 [Flagellimonas hymeniacidonis]|uniref:Shikimate kinase n=1 Tax=Flagellimonas hymeniacidonis TaxID=2603628 RepID=A0A5C8V122_9FLAO|nr:AAA family ATPase [Flagellimonas hymeniacidonis]TXN35214.1 hypothetical protein FVB32_11535 [Flagellimonas hymeniacidonis]